MDYPSKKGRRGRKRRSLVSEDEREERVDNDNSNKLPSLQLPPLTPLPPISESHYSTALPATSTMASSIASSSNASGTSSSSPTRRPQRFREDSAPRVLSHVNRRRRMYAKALNSVENERLAAVHRRLDFAHSLNQKQMDKQTEKLRRLLQDIDNRQKEKLHSSRNIGLNAGAILQPTSNNRKTSLVSNSCPTFAFSSTTPEEPLGRWVRYPKVLPSLEEDPPESDSEDLT